MEAEDEVLRVRKDKHGLELELRWVVGVVVGAFELGQMPVRTTA